MTFSLMHVDGSPEAAVIVPGGERAVMMVPLDALPQFLSILDDATADISAPCCAACGEPLPGRPLADTQG